MAKKKQGFVKRTYTKRAKINADSDLNSAHNRAKHPVRSQAIKDTGAIAAAAWGAHVARGPHGARYKAGKQAVKDAQWGTVKHDFHSAKSGIKSAGRGIGHTAVRGQANVYMAAINHPRAAAGIGVGAAAGGAAYAYKRRQKSATYKRRLKNGKTINVRKGRRK